MNPTALVPGFEATSSPTTGPWLGPWIASATRRIALERAKAEGAAQRGQPLAAASIARCTSARVPSGTVPIVSPVDGLVASRTAPPSDAVQEPATNWSRSLLDGDLLVDRLEVDALRAPDGPRDHVDHDRQRVQDPHVHQRLLVVDPVQVVAEPLPEHPPEVQGRDPAGDRDQRHPTH